MNCVFCNELMSKGISTIGNNKQISIHNCSGKGHEFYVWEDGFYTFKKLDNSYNIIFRITANQAKNYLEVRDGNLNLIYKSYMVSIRDLPRLTDKLTKIAAFI